MELDYINSTPAIVLDYGAPRNAYLEITVDALTRNIDWTLCWYTKTPTRMPEQLSFNFMPVRHTDGKIQVSKLSSWIDINPQHTMVNGSSHLHGQLNGVKVEDYMFTSLDVPLVSLGQNNPNPFVDPLPQFDAVNTTLVSFSIFNNIWGTVSIHITHT